MIDQDQPISRRYQELEERALWVAQGDITHRSFLAYVDSLAADLVHERSDLEQVSLAEDVMEELQQELTQLIQGMRLCEEGLAVLSDFADDPTIEVLEDGLGLVLRGFDEVESALWH